MAHVFLLIAYHRKYPPARTGFPTALDFRTECQPVHPVREDLSLIIDMHAHWKTTALIDALSQRKSEPQNC